MRSNKYVSGLDIIRFFAAAFVMLYHLGLGSWAGLDAVLPVRYGMPELRPLAWMGWIGVEIFFVISGFVIFNSAVGQNAIDFARHRILRLYPGAWVCATLTTCVALMMQVDSAKHLGKAWLVTIALLPYGMKVDSPYWTLAVEMSFYALVGMSIWLGALKHPIALLTALGVSSAFWNLYVVIFNYDLGMELMWKWWLEILFAQYGCLFALGGLIWMGETRRWTKTIFLVFLICLAGCIAETYLKSEFNRLMFYPSGSSALVVVVFLAAVAALWACSRFNDAISPLLGNWGRRLGLATYPLYLVHNLVGRQMLVVLVPSIGRWLALGTTLIACIVLAFLLLIPEKIIARKLKLIFERFVPSAEKPATRKSVSGPVGSFDMQS